MKFKKHLVYLLVLAHLATLPHPVGADAEKTIELPDIGDSTGTLMTPKQEAELGAAFYRNLHNQMEISQDPEVLDYIQTIGQKLAEQSDTPSQPFHFFVVAEPTINAFAGPGGYIGVNSGLMLLSEGESELASVLAHEISHVTQRHLYQAFQAASRMAIPTAVGMLAAAILGAKGGGQGAMGAMIAAQAASTQYQINFTRDNEAEADRVGMQILSKSEFDPRAMPTFFERMQQSTRFAGRNMPEFLLTHPVTVSRIADTRSRAEQFPYRQYLDSMVYQIIRAKLRTQTVPPHEAMAYFQAVAKQGTKIQQDVTAYGMALTLIKSARADEAKPILQRLVQTYPERSQFLNALAEAETETKNFAKAAQLYEGGLLRFPGNSALTLNYVRVLMVTGKPREANKLLQDYGRYHPPTPEVYELLAETYSKLGEEGESHRYLGEAYYAAGQTRTAILQFRLAERAVGDNYYLSSVVNERLRELLAEEAARRKER